MVDIIYETYDEALVGIDDDKSLPHSVDNFIHPNWTFNNTNLVERKIHTI